LFLPVVLIVAGSLLTPFCLPEHRGFIQ